MNSSFCFMKWLFEAVLLIAAMKFFNNSTIKIHCVFYSKL
ncbi:hypothetical protein G436_1525 [Leptospira interrogans serovar Hardjo str. Norma]|uniref:Uncharacterized protein n=1 Tax=Leptospira interrogans serovar Hardjo str. Norma TaxID=1279460 RepID=A0A0M4MSV6_LEPIR|nr:hypothetical protein G436_1525 [Leptospira interrogans serovar Hardjo str. Norma]